MTKEGFSDKSIRPSHKTTSEEAQSELHASDAHASAAVKIWRFYRDGFREMTIGKTLWAIILIKLFIFFFILRLFFFPNVLNRDYDSDEERAEAVRHHLIGGNP